MQEPLDEQRRRSARGVPIPDRRVADRRVILGRRLGDPSLGPTATLDLLAAVLARETRIRREPLVGDSFLRPGWDA